MELLKVDTLDEAMEKLVAYTSGIAPGIERVSLCESYGRILAEDIISGGAVPGFDRATVDGYAVRSSDTGGASESLPVFLSVIGEVCMGEEAPMRLRRGECAYVPTGGMIPEGADAMVMVEYCESFEEDQIAVYNSVSPGRNMVRAGDDIQKGQKALPRGRRIRPQDMGVLSSIGKTGVPVYQPWKTAILSTGDEILDPSLTPGAGQVRDVNTYGLYGEALRYGFQVVEYDVISDVEEQLKERVRSLMRKADVVVVSGGSSQGKKDATARIINELASSGAFTHGLAVKPGKPTILGYDVPTKTVLAGLPGHPAAALLLFELIVGGLWERLTGMEQTEKRLPVQAVLVSNVAASPGRKTYQLVRLLKGEDQSLLAKPIFGKSGLIRTMSEADGYLVLDVNEEGADRGCQVEVYLL